MAAHIAPPFLRYKMRYVLFITFSLSLWAAATQAQYADKVSLAKKILSQAQHLSFQRNTEYCGYITVNTKNQLVATTPLKGEYASCTPPLTPDDLTPIASYHTHGSNPRFGGVELPTYNDALADQEEGINGFVSTPGGRLWYIDSVKEVIIMLCNLDCLPSDPAFFEFDSEIPKEHYTYEEIRLLEQE